MLLKLDWGIVVKEPVNVVFEAFTEELWDVMSGGIETELRALTDGPLSVGSSYVHVAEYRSGRRVESKVKVEAYEPNQYVKLSWSSGEAGHWKWMFSAAGLANFWYSPGWGEEGSRLEVRFSEEDAGTRIRANTEHQLTGALIPLSFIMRWPAHMRVQRKLLRFKEAIEGRGVTATNG
jgi:uncharacterized protein YndB with AHSA1/START domain